MRPADQLSLVSRLRLEAKLANESEDNVGALWLSLAADRIEALEQETQRLAQVAEHARLDAATERARRIDAELDRERFRTRLAEGKAN